ncbi:hypothetical protein AMS68_003453 [Peltaster fructicola]|uniref:tripeptidyl-peptidase II n=1 Tax=Peltaster fructicola TaxID=286661 RepID=A0A6H0XTD8_9PEZI|nr:hypothetical protein AMS68_003453 [Peltaster fructicola]
MLFSVFASSFLVAGVLASPLTAPHVVHEKRSALPHGWVRRGALDKDIVLPMRIALTQSNLDNGHDWLMDVSTPGSENYGKHWTAEDVVNAFAPSDETISTVKSWLESAGIPETRHKLSDSRGWLKVDLKVAEAENLLKTKYHLYQHSNGQSQVACEQYSLPANIKDKHVDLVWPTVHFDTKLMKKSDESLAKRGHPTLGSPNSGSLPKLGQWLGGIGNVIQELSDCDKQITPWCLRVLYGLPPNQLLKTNPKNSYGIVEYTPQAYRPEDLDLFFSNFSTQQVGERPIEIDIDGGIVQQEVAGFGYNGESDLDLEYAMTLVYPQNVTLYQVGDETGTGSFSNLLDAFDGSFCADDNPNFDGVYPNPLPGGYQGPEQCGGIATTKVISTSYGYNEIDLTPLYEQRQCNEYLKLGLTGTSFLFSSGDNGVAGNLNECTIPGSPYGLNETLNNGTNGLFTPSFPSTCPYITAVGATQVKNNTNILIDLAIGQEPEMACEEVIYSGGGFSNVFPLPSYQSSAVKNYYANHNPPYGADRYNNSRAVRGYPDISANGANYVVAVDSQFALVYGTSASSPTLGSILTLINQERLNIGKSAIGFINPVAYAHPEVFNDITEGNNPGCGTSGFSAVSQWDPVTGLGTPNFPKMLALWLSLP